MQGGGWARALGVFVVLALMATVPTAVEAQRSTGAVGGPVTPAAPAPAPSPVSVAAMAPQPLAVRADCPWTADDGAGAGPERRQRIVRLAYCTLLGRPPDREGLAYWSAQLAGGLGTDELVLQLTGSAEYRNQRAGRDRWATSPFDALAALVAAPGPGPAAQGASGAATSAPSDPLAAGDGLRVRQSLTVGEFDRWVADRDLAEVERITPALVHGRIVGDGQQINVVYVHRSVTRNLRVSPGDRGRSTVGSWASEIGADAAVNGNWYAPWDGPAVSGGRVYGGSDHGYTALFGVTASGNVVLEHHREINDGVDARIVDGVSGHPTLVHRGRRTIDFGTDPTFLNRNPRTAIGLDATGDILILVTVDGRSSRARGMTGDETAMLMERLGAADAVMLDGGGSTTMWIAGRGVVNRPSGALRAVGNQVAVFGS